MPTTSFAFSSDLTTSDKGYWASQGAPFFGGHNTWAPAQSSEISRKFTGTGISITTQYVSADGAAQYRVDGGSWTDIATSGPSLGVDNVAASGLSEGDHTLDIRHVSGSFFLDESAAFKVTGASPAIANASGFGTRIRPLNAAHSPYVTTESTLFTGTEIFGGNPNGYLGAELAASGTFSGGCHRFKATPNGDTLYAWMRDGTGTVVVFRNGVQIAEWTGGGTNAYLEVALTGALTEDSEVEYEVLVSLSWNTYVAIWELRLGGGSGSVNLSTPLSARRLIVQYGDSNSVGTGLSPVNDCRHLFGYLVSRSLGVSFAGSGYGGSTIKHFASGSPANVAEAGETRTADVTRFGSLILGFFDLYWTNDYNQVAGAETSTEARASAATEIAAIDAALPADAIAVLMDIPPFRGTAGGGEPALSTWNAAKHGALADAGSPSKWQTYDTAAALASLDINTNGSMTTDGIHLTNAANALLASGVLSLFVDTTPPTVARRRAGSARTGTRTAIYN